MKLNGNRNVIISLSLINMSFSLTEIIPVLILVYYRTTLYQYGRDTWLQSNDWQLRRAVHRYVKVFVNMDYSLLECTRVLHKQKLTECISIASIRRDIHVYKDREFHSRNSIYSPPRCLALGARARQNDWFLPQRPNESLRVITYRWRLMEATLLDSRYSDIHSRPRYDRGTPFFRANSSAKLDAGKRASLYLSECRNRYTIYLQLLPRHIWQRWKRLFHVRSRIFITRAFS